MKKIFIKPSVRYIHVADVCILASSSFTGAVDGSTIIPDGGNTLTGGITDAHAKSGLLEF